MSGNILWKFLLTAAILAWCVLSITPLKDRPFEAYILSQATADVDTFESIVERAKQRVEDSREADGATGQTLFLALRELGAEENIDFAGFFPEINLKDVPNQNKRNDILLKHLLKTARASCVLVSI